MEVIPVTTHNSVNLSNAKLGQKSRTNNNRNSAYGSNNNRNNRNNNIININTTEIDITELIHKIWNDFLKNYRDNLESFIPTINQDFLDRVTYTDETLKKTPEELKDEQKNIDFRKQIYLDFVLYKMDKIFEIQSKQNNKSKEADIDELYQQYSYDNTFNIKNPIETLIEKSIIPNYQKLDKNDIILHQLNSHGGVERILKRLQKNCIVVLITPLNRYTYFCDLHLSKIRNIIGDISEKITDSNNNIYDIVKMIEKYKCFDKSTIIYPNQYYFDYLIKTDDNCNGGKCYKSNSKQFETVKESFNTTLDQYIEDYIKSNPEFGSNKVNIFFVRGCRSLNVEESYNNFSIEKMYIYENFIKILNRIIYKQLSYNDFQIDESIDCKLRIESKIKNVLTKRTTKNESKKLILNKSLSPKISDSMNIKEYESINYFIELIRMILTNKIIKEYILFFINYLIKKNKLENKMIIDTDVIINFIEQIKYIFIKKILNDYSYFYLLSFYIIIYNIREYSNKNKDDNRIVLEKIRELENIILKNNTFLDKELVMFNENNLLFKYIINNQFNNIFDINIINILFLLYEKLINFSNSENEHYNIYFHLFYNIILSIIITKIDKIIDKIINSITYIINNDLLTIKIFKLVNLFTINQLKLLEKNMKDKKITHNRLYYHTIILIIKIEPTFIIKNGHTIFDSLNDNECKIKLVKYFLKKKIPLLPNDKKMINNSLSINKNIYLIIDNFFYETPSCEKKIELFDIMSKNNIILFNCMYWGCMNSYFKDIDILSQINNNANNNKIKNMKELKKNIIKDIFVLSRTISQLLINEANLNIGSINNILRNMEYNINGLKLKLKQIVNNDSIYKQTMQKMIKLITDLIDDDNLKKHLCKGLYEKIFNNKQYQDVCKDSQPTQTLKNNHKTQPTQILKNNHKTQSSNNQKIQNQNKTQKKSGFFKTIFGRFTRKKSNIK